VNAYLVITRCLLLLLAIASMAFAPAPFPKPPKPDSGKVEQKRLQGTWTVSRRTINGSDQTARSSDMTVEIVGDRIRFLVGGDARTEWTFTLDVTKNPRVMDRKRVWSKGTGAATPGKAALQYLGIYRLDGEMLQFVHASGPGSQERPSDFEGKKRGQTMYLLKRVKR
jgi:uncharacterized protein (TIGR03067 family)